MIENSRTIPVEFGPYSLPQIQSIVINTEYYNKYEKDDFKYYVEVVTTILFSYTKCVRTHLYVIQNHVAQFESSLKLPLTKRMTIYKTMIMEYLNQSPTAIYLELSPLSQYCLLAACIASYHSVCDIQQILNITTKPKKKRKRKKIKKIFKISDPPHSFSFGILVIVFHNIAPYNDFDISTIVSSLRHKNYLSTSSLLFNDSSTFKLHMTLEECNHIAKHLHFNLEEWIPQHY